MEIKVKLGNYYDYEIKLLIQGLKELNKSNKVKDSKPIIKDLIFNLTTKLKWAEEDKTS